MFFEATTELIGFIASFFATGAAAFRYVVLRDDAAAEREVERRAARRAAIFGITGAAISALMYVLHSLPGAAARQHKTILKAAVATGPVTIQTVCIFLLVIGFALALARLRAGWALAAIAVVAPPASAPRQRVGGGGAAAVRELRGRCGDGRAGDYLGAGVAPVAALTRPLSS